jgi:hypothetical protein
VRSPVDTDLRRNGEPLSVGVVHHLLRFSTSCSAVNVTDPNNLLNDMRPQSGRINQMIGSRPPNNHILDPAIGRKKVYHARTSDIDHDYRNLC